MIVVGIGGFGWGDNYSVPLSSIGGIVPAKWVYTDQPKI